MSIHLIIDGYNLIRQSHELSSLDRRNLELGREALLDRLAIYKRLKRHKITVVFDGTNASDITQQKDRVKGVEIRFSREGESADTVIKRMAATERERALVVSSDRDVVNYAASRGAATVSSPVFEEKVAMAATINHKGADSDDEGGWIPTTKKKGPRRRQSKKDRRSRVKIRKL
jgi:predicted RNA-binding protein with PIN domain